MNREWKRLLPDVKQAFETFCEENLEQFDSNRGETDVTCLCPFCGGGGRNDLTFDVNVETGAWRCWREHHCGKRGNAGGLVSEVLGLERASGWDYLKGDRSDPRYLKSYVKHLDRFLMDVRDHGDIVPDTFMVDVDDVTPVHEHENGWEVLEWLEVERGHDPDLFLQLNDVVVPDQDRFYGRIAFQFTSEGNLAYQLYAFKRGVEPKTLNPSDSILSRTLYWWDRRQGLDFLIVTEGIMDCSRLTSYGLDAVACFGVNLSEEQIVMLALSEYEEIIIFFDQGAEDRARRAAETLSEYASGKTISHVCPKKLGADPDDLTFDEVFDCLDRRTIVSTRAETSMDRIIGWVNEEV